jgi:hypothetical protein
MPRSARGDSIAAKEVAMDTTLEREPVEEVVDADAVGTEQACTPLYRNPFVIAGEVIAVAGGVAAARKIRARRSAPPPRRAFRRHVRS